MQQAPLGTPHPNRQASTSIDSRNTRQVSDSAIGTSQSSSSTHNRTKTSSNGKNSKLITLLHPIASPLPIQQNSKLIQLPHHIAFTPWLVARSYTTIVHAEQSSCLLLLGWLEQVAQSWPPLSTHMTEVLCMDL